MSIEQGLFLLLRHGLGTACVSDAPQLLLHYSLEEWKRLMDLAQRQAVCAIAVDGLHAIVDSHGNIFSAHYGQSQWQSLLFKWTGILFETERANVHQTKTMLSMASAWNDAGCRIMLMKGQANGLYYPKPEHRSVGDIDIYMFGSYDKAHEVARTMGATVNEGWYKHSEVTWEGEVFENHRYLVPTRQGKRSKKLDSELKAEVTGKELKHFLNSSVLLPTPMFNAKFLTFHSFAHFLAEGIRLKQLLDWAMFVREEQNNLDWNTFYSFCDKYHYRRFADAATAIAVSYLGVKIFDASISRESPYAERIVHSALYDDDYVYSTGSGWYNRWHLVKNLWKYSWKYHTIYQQSPLRQLYYHVTGYFFKTE